MLVCCQLCSALAQYRNLSCSSEATNYSCNSNILVESNGGYDLRPQEHPFVNKHLRFNPSIAELFISYKSVMDTLEEPLLALLFQLIGDVVFPVSRLLTESVSVRSSFLYDVVGNGKELHRVLDEFLIFLSSFTQEVPARATDDSNVPV